MNRIYLVYQIIDGVPSTDYNVFAQYLYAKKFAEQTALALANEEPVIIQLDENNLIQFCWGNSKVCIDILEVQ